MLFAALAGQAAPSLGAMSPSLEARVDASGPSDRIAVIATLRAQVGGERFEGRPQALLRALRSTAARTQADVADDIDRPVRRFWLVNAIAFSGTPREIREVAADPAVDAVDADVEVRVADAPSMQAATPFPDAGTGDWGLAAIKVPTVWSAYGLRGAGVTIGTIDTGVNGGHPDLAGKIAAWRDFVSGSPTPVDENGHGTHTAGTLVGGSAGGAPIGVAPDAHLIVARAMGADGVGPGSALLAAAEWMTDPDGNPATPDQPGIVSNSWSASTANDTWFRPMIRRWLDLGMVPVFAAGNAGPSAGSVGSPAGYPEAIAVGAIDSNDGVPSFSGRGPVVWQNADGLGPAAGTVLSKPDLAAPGVGITSSTGSGYLSYSGTSMAAPHVAGVAALLRQANPALSAQAVGDILRLSADDIGTPGIDPNSGFGRLDALRAVEAAAGPAPDTRFTATPAALTNARPLTYAVAVTGGGTAVRTRVDGGPWSAPTAPGTLALDVPEGRHVVEAQAIDAAGVVDATPARHAVTVDRTGPRVEHPDGPRGHGHHLPRHGQGRAQRGGPRHHPVELRRGPAGARGDGHAPLRRGRPAARGADRARRGRQRELRRAPLRAAGRGRRARPDGPADGVPARQRPDRRRAPGAPRHGARDAAPRDHRDHGGLHRPRRVVRRPAAERAGAARGRRRARRRRIPGARARERPAAGALPARGERRRARDHAGQAAHLPQD